MILNLLFLPCFSRGTLRQVAPAPQAKVCIFWRSRKRCCSAGPIFLGGSGNRWAVQRKQKSNAPPGRRRNCQPAVPAREHAEKGLIRTVPIGSLEANANKIRAHCHRRLRSQPGDAELLETKSWYG